MNGIQRFILCTLSLVAIMICFSDYGNSILGFAGLALGGLVVGLILFSLIVGVLGLDRFKALNSLFTLLILAGFIYYLLIYFPQADNISPLAKLKNGYVPSGADIQRGAERFKFRFNFLKGFAPQPQQQPQQVQPQPQPKPQPKPEEDYFISIEDAEENATPAPVEVPDEDAQ